MLFNYYSIDECTQKQTIKTKLNNLKKEGKIDYSMDGDIIKIVDLDLDESEIEDLVTTFDQYEVYPYTDYFEEDEDGFDDEYGYEDDYDNY